MQVPIIAGVDPASCRHERTDQMRRSGKPTRRSRHRKEMLRYLVLVIALVAVSLLIAIALYYTQGNSVTIEHISSLAPQFCVARLS